MLADSNLSVTRDGGATWDLRHIVPASGEYACHDVRDVAIALKDPSVVFADSNSGGLIVSTDSGDTWPLTSCGIQPFGARQGIAVDPASSMIAYAGAGTGIRTTVDGAVTWQSRDVGQFVRARSRSIQYTRRRYT